MTRLKSARAVTAYFFIRWGETMSRKLNEDEGSCLEGSRRLSSLSRASKMFVIQIGNLLDFSQDNNVTKSEALTGQMYELRCSSSDSVWSVKGSSTQSQALIE